MRVETAVPLGRWRDAAEAARAAEAAGYDAVFAPELHSDPFLALAPAALATERLGLATEIAVAFPRSPTVLAHSAWDLHVQSGGRFRLGLGSQVKGHIERRFGVPWTAPVPRMREYVGALRAVWRSWERREPLRFEGEHYRLTLMTPDFSPPPSKLPPIPVLLAAVGPAMLRLAGRHCDGVVLHPLATRRYVEELALPQLRAGLEAAGRPRGRFEILGGGFVATGTDAAEVEQAFERVRQRVAFYASTRSYRDVLRLHGWEDLGLRLHDLSLRGRWKEMAREVPDEVVHACAAVGTHEEIAAAVERRFGGIADTVDLSLGPRTPPGRVREIVEDVARIPQTFEGFPDAYDD